MSWVELEGAQAVRVVVDTTEEFLEGAEATVSIDEPGRLSPGPDLELVADLKDLNIWSAALDGSSGNILVGTGPQGELFRVRKSGKVERVSAFIESDVYAVAAGTKGSFFVASSPHGKVFLVDAAGKVEEYFNPKEEFIWSMLMDKKGVLYVATGPAGKFFG
ncbi:MAG: hypothetical protein HC904_08750 [Blastochloris sp.]|nr:hypothetical protein [Blastochloris sp.]